MPSSPLSCQKSHTSSITDLAVFRIAGTVAFIANAIAIIPESVWFGRPWSMTFKNIVDALAYGLLTGGVFGWLA